MGTSTGTSPLAAIAAHAPRALAGAGRPVRTMVALEQAHLDRRADPRLFVRDTTTLDLAYRPEGRKVFALEAYRLDATVCERWRSSGPGRALPPALARLSRDEDAALLLVHPQSRDHYAALLRRDGVRRIECGTWLATPLSSARSLLVWERDAPQRPFIVKLSLDAIIGTVPRTIRATRVAKCVGLTALLDGADDLPDDFGFLGEHYGVAPRRMPRGGMLLRAIPPQVLSGERLLIPAYALSATPADGTPPLLRMLAERHRMRLGEFVYHAIVVPFARQWTALAIDAGIVFEAHGQNLLLELDASLTPTGRLVHRDLEDLSVDLEHRRRHGLYVPDDLPLTAGHDAARIYQQRRHRWWLRHSLAVFFEGGVLQPIERAIAGWLRSGAIDRAQAGPYRLRQMFRRELGEALAARIADTGVARTVEIHYDRIDRFVLSTRAARGSSA
jgi:hypothetical protein